MKKGVNKKIENRIKQCLIDKAGLYKSTMLNMLDDMAVHENNGIKPSRKVKVSHVSTKSIGEYKYELFYSIKVMCTYSDFFFDEFEDETYEREDSGEEEQTFEIAVICNVYDFIEGNPSIANIERVMYEKDLTPLALELYSDVNTLDIYLEIVMHHLNKYNISDAGRKTLREFFTFKYQTLIDRDKHLEAAETYYNLVVYGEDIKIIKSFIGEFPELLHVDKNRYELFTESRLLNHHNVIRDFEGREIVCIYDCQDKPSINENASTSSARDQTEKELLMYNQVWDSIANYAKAHPTVTMIIGVNEFVYRTSIMTNNEIYHRIFGHRLCVDPITQEQVIKECISRLKNTQFRFENGFFDAFRKYVETIYRTADLKGEEFITDVINRIFSYYYRKKITDNVVTKSCIPKYNNNMMSSDDVLAKLNGLVGLEAVKKEFDRIHKLQIADMASAKKDNNHHMMFYGNPGTGKTTVARLTADLLCQTGFLKTNKYTEVSVSDLVSPYKSNSGKVVKSLVQSALDGVLFIDEAYGMAEENDHGVESLNILIQEMEKCGDRLVVIMAGYEDKMEKLFDLNAGLRSRIGHKIKFEDYTAKELRAIFELKMKEIGFTIERDATEVLDKCLNAMRYDDNFGNGRDVANLLSKLRANWADDYYMLSREKANRKFDMPKVIKKKYFDNLVPDTEETTLQNMVGLESVKKQLGEFDNQVAYINTLKKRGMKKLPESFMHMIFMGNPGTGKTEVAKLIAKALYKREILNTDNTVIVERKDLISPHPGVTSQNVEKFIKKAMGGVLFIDEAYALADAGSEGIEAIEVLLTAMVNYKDELVIIYAGYPKEMARFLQLNPGIQSRIGYSFMFKDYDTDQLMQIFEIKMEKAEFILDGLAKKKVREIMDYFKDSPGFGNGRFVDKVVTRTIAKRAKRECTLENYNRITGEDIPTIAEMIETESFGRMLVNPEEITEEDKYRTAYHELGHALAIYKLDVPMKIKSVSIKTNARSLGRVSYKYSKNSITEKDMYNEIIIDLAGRCAERVLLGGCDAGCVSDYEHAKSTAKKMIEDYGMCDIGKTTITDLLRECDEKAKELVSEYKEVIEKIAKQLVEGKEFTGDEINAIFKKHMK